MAVGTGVGGVGLAVVVVVGSPEGPEETEETGEANINPPTWGFTIAHGIRVGFQKEDTGVVIGVAIYPRKKGEGRGGGEEEE